MIPISWRPEAREELIDIFITIAEDNPEAAERVVRDIESRVRLLESNPRLGVRRPEISSSARMLVRGVYIVLYEIAPDDDAETVEMIEVIGIVHGHRDLSRVF